MPKLLHLTDLHVGPSFRPELAEAVARAVRAVTPDAVVVSGDVVDFGEWAAPFRRASSFLRGLGRPLAVAPGNHDIPRLRLGQRLRAPLQHFVEHFRDGDPRHAQAPLADTVIDVGEAVVYCLSTPRWWTLDLGHVSAAQLAHARAVFEAAPPERPRVVVMHHGLRQLGWLPIPNAVRGHRPAVRAFSEMGVDLVLTGHNHFPHVELLGRPRPFVWSQGGTATTHRYRHLAWRKSSLGVIELDHRQVTIEWWFYEPDRRRFEPAQRRCFDLPRR